MRSFANVTSGLERQLRSMIVIQRPERTNHRQVICTFPDILEPIAHHEAALAVALEPRLQGHDYFAVSVRGIAANDVGIDLFWIQYALVGRLVDRLARVLVQLRLDIKTFQVAHASAKKNPNHRLRFRRKM